MLQVRILDPPLGFAIQSPRAGVEKIISEQTVADDTTIF